MSIIANGLSLRLVRHAPPIIASRFVIVAICAVLSLQLGGPARADAVDVDFVKGQLPIANDSITGLGTDLFGDKINLYNGSLQFEQTDISIPGNNSLPVALARYRDAGRSLYVRGAMGDWDIHAPRIEGTFGDYIGWRLASGGPRCTGFGVLDTIAANGWSQTEGGIYRVVIYFQPWDYEGGINIVVPGQGSREILRKTGNPISPSDGNSYPLVTSDKWQVGCLPSVQNGDGEGFFALSPDGVK